MKTIKPITEFKTYKGGCLCWHCGLLASCPYQNKDVKECSAAWASLKLYRVHNFFPEAHIPARFRDKHTTPQIVHKLLNKKGVVHFIKGDEIYYPVEMKYDGKILTIKRREVKQ